MTISKSNIVNAFIKALADSYKHSTSYRAEVVADQPGAIFFYPRTMFGSQEPFYFRIHYVSKKWAFYGHGIIPEHPEIITAKYFLQVAAAAIAKL